MSRNGAGIYTLPAGSVIANGDTSDAADLNVPLADLEADMNTPRPIVAGGTGASTAADARTNLGVTLNNLGVTIPASVINQGPDEGNRIINGAFDFWQRGTSQTSNGYGSADRWQNVVLGGTVTMSRQSFTLGDTLGSNSPTFFLRQSVSGQTLSSQVAYVAQRIEDVRSYAGQTITILGWARRSSGSGNMGVNVTQGFGTGGASPSGFVNTAGQIVTLSSSWQPFAVTFAIPSVTGKTLGTDGNSFIQPNFWTSAGSDFNASSGSLGLQTIGVDLWGIHIKVGTHTTAAVDLYRQPELGPELARCQRYYETGSYQFGSAATDGSGVSYGRIFFKTTKRNATYSVSRIDQILTNASASTAGDQHTDGFDISAGGLATGSLMRIRGIYTVDNEL